jgi:hypothetical protein
MSHADTLVAVEPPVQVRLSKANAGLSISALLFVALVSCVAFYGQTAPAKVASDAAAADFSSGRAMKQLEVISQRPHPIGSAEHAAVREHLLKELSAAGVGAEVQTATVADSRRGGAIRAATVRNVIARLPGTQGGGKAVMIVSHYDTVHQSPGASDDGSSVATMLETLRAVKAGTPLKNDVVFLFTDGEESGLMGAKAFVNEHPLAKNVGLVLNFEARGASGAVWMFETSRENSWLIGELAKAAPHPNANSLAYEIYRLLPNDTDFTVFREAKIPGLNFAHIDDQTRYHTRIDNIENIDERSVQHQGSYALSLVRHFGNIGLEDTRGGNAIYFDLLGMKLLHYPATLVLPLTALAVALFVGVVLLGVRRGRVRLAGIAAGFGAYLLSLVDASGIVLLLWWLIRTVQTATGHELWDDSYQGKLYLAGFVAVAVAVAASVYNLLRGRISSEGLTLGALLFLLALLALASVYVPGATYLLLWPLLFGLVAAGVALSAAEGEAVSFKLFAVLMCCAVPAILLLVPMIYNVFVAMGFTLLVALPLMVMLLYGFLVPIFGLMTRSHKWLLPGGAALVALVFILLAGLTGGFDRNNPNADHLFYAMNADTNKAVWGSTDPAPDEWTSQFLGERPERGSLSEFVPSSYSGFLKNQAPLVSLPLASVQVIGDDTKDGRRTLRMRITAASPVINLTVASDDKASVLASVVNGKRVEAAAGPPAANKPGSPWMLQYWAPPADGFDLTLEMSAAQPLKLQVSDQWYGLPAIEGATARPRPDHLMPMPFSNSDTTSISKSYTF